MTISVIELEDCSYGYQAESHLSDHVFFFYTAECFWGGNNRVV